MPRPDEGLIHAWLDGQLPPDEATRIGELVANDAEWGAAAAEARGLVAASSRILSALDHVPSGVIPKGRASPAVRRLPWWTKAAAAVLLVAGTSLVVMQRSPAPLVAPAAAPASAAPPRVNAPAPAAPPTVNAPARKPVATNAVVAERKTSPASVQPFIDSARAVASRGATEGRADAMRADAGRGVATRDAREGQSRDVASVVAERAATNAARSFAAKATSSASTLAAPVPSVVAAPTPMPAMQVVGGLAGGHAVPAKDVGACFRLRDSSTQVELPLLMRGVRHDGDTLRLEPAHGAGPLRAWLVWNDVVGRGMLATEPDGRGALPVTATPATCPQP
jgi:hypothetical protein